MATKLKDNVDTSQNMAEIKAIIKKNMKEQGMTFQDLKRLADEKRK